MRKGPWHQCGDKSQRLVDEQLQNNLGVGVILSPRDLARHLAPEYARKYRDAGASVVIDHQFYTPGFTNDNLKSYSTNTYRRTVPQLNKITDQELDDMAKELSEINKEIGGDALIAPAIVYEASRPDIVQLNSRLFNCSKNVGDSLGVPTYATVVIGASAITADAPMEALLSYATALNADGFYFSFEFGSDDRIPSDFDLTLRCASAGLILACTGKPVLHAFAGPMSILSPGFGATGAGIGHSQNLWQFSRQRWAPPNKKQEGGPGAAPPRFYSAELCGTVVFPDEITLLDQAMQDKIWTESPFTAPAIDSGAPWGRWESNKHLVSVLCESVQAMATLGTARACARQSIEMLDRAVKLHEQISKVTSLKDKTNEYQKNWKAAMQNLLTEKSCDFDYLELIS